ncbi:hypothetical protein [Glaciihabitans sp. dw_435]|uniref:hypothetical protein n=1 Tax=Glaciihabitans sp. dw_435 TaxID=2720081 RepID=UPI001BD26777|nr:hypothetical protein [Glaciihabitans sp. dw_435]
MTRHPFLLAAAVGIVVVASVSGCSGTLTLNAHDAGTDLVACTPAEPVTVESLDVDRRASCVPAGVPLVFPDGARVDLPLSNAGTGSTGGGDGRDTYTYVSVGIFGLYASHASANCTGFHEWGSPTARERVHEAFGERYGCD